MFKKYSILIPLSISNCAFANKIHKKDSLETEFKNNLVYIVHKVEGGQTLYSLLNKYSCSINEVFDINPSLNNSSNIKLGEKIRFPMIKNGKHVSSAAYIKINKPLLEPIISNGGKNTVIKHIYTDKQLHEVLVTETIYSISKKFGLTTEQLTDANGVFENRIIIGQKLLIDKKEIEKLLKPEPLEKPDELPFERLNRGKLISENGLAEVINTKNRTNKFLALHRSAPVGSVIKVTNEATGISIKAKVVGNLSETGPDHDILVKLSPYAFSKLKPKDSKLRARVDFFE